MGINTGWTVFFMSERRFRPWETAALLSLCLTLLWGCWADARQRSIASGLVRLHVIAASDEAEEQALKLRVRDAVLAWLRPRLAEAADAAEAEEILLRELPGIREAALAASEGRSVMVSLGPEDYPLRRYGGFTLPAGRYESLRVVLGEGEGHNWWCVIFPSLCLDAAETEPLQATLSGEDYALVTGESGFRLRFRLVELWGELRLALS
jgi:stage II sporulation protein R